MDKGIYTAVASIKADKLRQINSVHEVSNVSTTGFKKAFQMTVKTFRTDSGAALSSRYFKTAESIGRVDLTPGSRIVTNNPLDIFIEDKGVMGVFNDKDQLVFTRRGDLRLSPEGVLLNGEGVRIASDAGGDLQLDPALIHRISREGIIYATNPEEEVAEEVEVGRILLRNAEDTFLEKMEDGLFKPEGFAEPTDFQGSEDPVFVTSQALEGSSAKTYDVLTQMIELERSYEIKINIIKELSDLNQTSNTLMQLS